MKICYTKKHHVEFWVDEEDYEFVLNHTWSCNDGYIVTNIKGINTPLHRLLMNTPKGMDTDHVDGKLYNNQKSNLRICTHEQNVMNRSKTTKKTSSKYKGVSWYKKYQNWKAAVCVGKLNMHIGYFDNEKEAALAYNARAVEVFGEFAKLNIITEDN